jgi:23S rRNA (guanosine2251-2'-O)-methyltransferase
MPHHRRRDKPAAPRTTQWIHGRHAVTAALANPARRVLRVVGLRENADELAALLREARADAPEKAEPIERGALEGLLERDAVHQGMALEAQLLAEIDLDTVLDAIPAEGAPHILVLLDQVTDPHNVGAILRSAAAFRALGVVVPDHGAPHLAGSLAKAASGALEAVPLIRVTNLSRCMDRLKEEGFWCVGLAGDADAALEQLDLPDRIALVLGAEGAGLRRLVRETCDFVAHLATRGDLSSLNVSNAAAVALYALTRVSAAKRNAATSPSPRQ